MYNQQAYSPPKENISADLVKGLKNSGADASFTITVICL